MRGGPEGRVKARRSSEEGAELLEMALVLPILLMLLLGIIAFGRAYDIYQTITRAAREGARQAVLTGCATCANPTTIPPSSTVQTSYVNPSLQAANLDPGQVQNYLEQYVWLDPSDTPPQVCGIQISFQYPYTLTLPFTSLNLTTLNIPTTVRMRLENQPTDPSTGAIVCPVGTSP